MTKEIRKLDYDEAIALKINTEINLMTPDEIRSALYYVLYERFNGYLSEEELEEELETSDYAVKITF